MIAGLSSSSLMKCNIASQKGISRHHSCTTNTTIGYIFLYSITVGSNEVCTWG